MKFTIYLLIASMITSTCFGYDVTHLNKDDKAQYEGYLFSVESEKQLRLLDSNYTYEKALNNSLIKINGTYQENEVIMQQRIENKDKEIQNLTERLSDKSDGILSKLAFFLLGAATTTVIAYGVSKAIK